MSVNLLKSASLAFIIASIPDIASLPKSVDAVAAFSVSESFPNFSRNCIIISLRPKALPLLSVIDIPSLLISLAILFVGDAKLDKAVFRLVPAIEPFTLALAIRPSASETSSTE